MTLSKLKHNSFDNIVEGNPSLIINGNMAVAQRGDVTLSAISSAYGGCDRWVGYISAGTATMDLSQDTDVPSGQGFSNSQKMTCSTTGTFSTASYSLIGQLIEGQNCQHLKFGTSSAESLTLSFWAKSNKTGTFNIEIRQVDSTPSNYQNISQLTIDTANTWEYKTLTVAGNTSNDIRNNNFAGLQVYMWLKTGSNYTSGGDKTGDGWITYNAANVGHGADLDITTSTSDFFSITGVKLEGGSTATPFHHESYAENLAKCRRYFETNYPEGNYPGDTIGNTIGAGLTYRTTAATTYNNWPFKVRMRANPALVAYNGLDGGTGDWRGSNSTDFSVTFYDNEEYFCASISNANSLVRSAFYTADAEL